MDDRKPAAKPVIPKKKNAGNSKKRKATADTSPHADLSAVLPWIPRAQLETLITMSVNNQAAITNQQLINAMPDNERWRITDDGKKKKSFSPVKSAPERVNTGTFDAVDSATMLNILTFLNCKEKFTCVTSVSKSWRIFKESMPTLFLDLSDNSWTVRGKAMQASQLLVLMDWVPNLAKITALRISTQEKCNPNTCKLIVKKLVAAKKKAKEPMISKLVLHGPKIYGSLIPELTKNEIGKTLTSLTFHDVKTTQQTKLAGAIGDLLRSLPALSELYMPSELGNNLHSLVFVPLMAARSGAPTLLRVLDLGERSSVFDQTSLMDLSKIGTSAPELEVLRLAAVAGPISAALFPQLINPTLALDSPMTSLPRLKEFAIGRLVKSFAYRSAPKYASTEEVNRLLTWLLAGMPAVERFSFAHGETSMTRKDEKMFSYPSLPGIVPPGAEVMWPHTLKQLSLSSFYLAADTFTANTEFPSLKSLELKRCGGNVDTIINGLRSTHPNVEVTKIESSYSYW